MLQCSSALFRQILCCNAARLFERGTSSPGDVLGRARRLARGRAITRPGKGSSAAQSPIVVNGKVRYYCYVTRYANSLICRLFRPERSTRIVEHNQCVSLAYDTAVLW